MCFLNFIFLFIFNLDKACIHSRFNQMFTDLEEPTSELFEFLKDPWYYIRQGQKRRHVFNEKGKIIHRHLAKNIHISD